jgi:hypothetical protein
VRILSEVVKPVKVFSVNLCVSVPLWEQGPLKPERHRDTEVHRDRWSRALNRNYSSLLAPV